MTNKTEYMNELATSSASSIKKTAIVCVCIMAAIALASAALVFGMVVAVGSSIAMFLGLIGIMACTGIIFGIAVKGIIDSMVKTPIII